MTKYGDVGTTRVLRKVQDDDGDHYLIGLRESPEPTSWSIIFMESDADPDDEDIEMGMDSYCIVVDPGQATWYGGVRECQLDGNQLSMTLDSDASVALGLAERTTLELLVSQDDLAMVRNGLKRVFSSGPLRERPVVAGLD